MVKQEIIYKIVGDYLQHCYSGGNYIGGGNSNFFKSTVIQNVGTVNGEWLQVQLPYQLKLLGYYMLNRDPSIFFNRYPSTFYIVGSNDGSGWFQVDYRTNQSDITNSYNYYRANTNNYYSYFRLVVNRVNGGNKYQVVLIF